MKKEIIVTAKTVEEARAKAAEELGVDAEALEVVDAVVYFIKTVIELVVVVTRRTAKTERIDVVDNAFVDVTHDGVSFVNA